MGSSLIGRVDKHQGRIRVLKRESRGHERTCSTLAMVRCSRGGIHTDLGEMGNWAALVDNWRQVLVRWTRNYLAEFPGASIYST